MNANKLGMGVMLGMLSGNKSSVDALTSCIGKTIKELSLGTEDNALHFVMEDGTKMKLYDDGQSCCESRYMRTDDKLSEFVGAKLLGATIKKADNLADEYGEHEIEFLDVETDRGVFQMCSHNEHNGYYGGFYVIAALEQPLTSSSNLGLRNYDTPATKRRDPDEHRL